MEKLQSTTAATFTNPSFQYVSELGKRLKYSLRPKHKNHNFESKGKLKSYVRIWVSVLNIKGIYIKNKAGHILNLMDGIFQIFFTENE